MAPISLALQIHGSTSVLYRVWEFMPGHGPPPITSWGSDLWISPQSLLHPVKILRILAIQEAKLVPSWHFYTPHLWCDGCNSFGIVCVSLSVCVSVRPSHSAGWTDRYNDLNLNWHGGQVGGYLVQVRRSRSYVKGQGHQVKKCFMVISIAFLLTLNKKLVKVSRT